MYILIIAHEYGANAYPFPSYELLKKALMEYVKDMWREVFGHSFEERGKFFLSYRAEKPIDLFFEKSDESHYICESGIMTSLEEAKQAMGLNLPKEGQESDRGAIRGCSSG